MKTLDEVLTAVTNERTLVDSLITLTGGIKQQLDEVLKGQLTPEQQAKVDAIFDKVEEERQAVAKAITDNTPAAPTQPS